MPDELVCEYCGLEMRQPCVNSRSARQGCAHFIKRMLEAQEAAAELIRKPHMKALREQLGIE
jgi:hypothetical protein